MNRRYVIGKYYRLSSEDDDLNRSGKLESNSISNQRTLVESFIARTPELADAETIEYFDDGWSGKNFDRPEVQRMLADVRKGRINCIVVKDLSRFGRDYLTVGNYISQVFPFLGVRLIAINDGFDSIRPTDIDSLETSFKTILYDLYSRDISRKVRNAKTQRAKRGDFQSPFAPFGYRKDPENKKQLVIDPEAASIVRKIFELAASGVGAEEIARRLNQDDVPTKMVYKRKAGCSRESWTSVGEKNFWTRQSVAAIIRDERYTGKSIFGKRTRQAVGDYHTVKNDRADWIVVENAHCGIVSRETFKIAQESLKKFSERSNAVSHNRPLERKVRCGICGHIMVRSGGKNTYYYCGTPRVASGCACTAETIPESELMELLLNELRLRAKAAVDVSKLWRERNKNTRESSKTIRLELSNLREDLSRRDMLLRELYESFACGVIGKEEYLRKKVAASKEKNEIADKMSELETHRAKLESSADDSKSFASAFQRYDDVDEITADIAREVLDGVVIYPNHRLEVTWKFQKEYETLMKQLDTTKNF